MFKNSILVLALVSLFAGAGARADADAAQRGGKTYRACVACHTLAPGLHISGPSLSGFLGRKAGSIEGYVRYSPGLKSAGFEWTEQILDGWLSNPETMIPGTYMSFPGIEDPKARADLIAFLVAASAPGGAKKAVADGLIPEGWIAAGAPKSLRGAQASSRISAIRHCGDSYFIKTEDGTELPFWEKNVRLKIDSVESGPPSGVPVLLGSGMRGDRVSVVFASLTDLTAFVREAC